MKHIEVRSTFPPMGQYSHAIEVPSGSRLLYISGQIGVDREGRPGETFRLQVEYALANLKGVLSDAGASGVGSLVQMTHYMVGEVDLQAFRELRTVFLGDERPCSSLIYVSRLFDTRFLYEVDAVALLR